jgi:hypothetical protein
MEKDKDVEEILDLLREKKNMTPDEIDDALLIIKRVNDKYRKTAKRKVFGILHNCEGGPSKLIQMVIPYSKE